jgi:hypothetical protein
MYYLKSRRYFISTFSSHTGVSLLFTSSHFSRAISFVNLLQQWLEVHPLKYQKCYRLWISQATRIDYYQYGMANKSPSRLPLVIAISRYLV